MNKEYQTPQIYCFKLKRLYTLWPKISLHQSFSVIENLTVPSSKLWSNYSKSCTRSMSVHIVIGGSFRCIRPFGECTKNVTDGKAYAMIHLNSLQSTTAPGHFTVDRFISRPICRYFSVGSIHH
jgi:hypothetical protein